MVKDRVKDSCHQSQGQKKEKLEADGPAALEAGLVGDGAGERDEKACRMEEEHAKEQYQGKV